MIVNQPTLMSWKESLFLYTQRRFFLFLAMGFSSGMPILLVFSTLSAWLAQEGVSKAVIGSFSLASSAYALKFLWSPIVDQFRIPVLFRLVGKRRSWLLLSQCSIIGAILFMGVSNPAETPLMMFLAATALAFSSATHDIVADAWRVEMLDDHEIAAGTAVFVFGYRLAMLVSGGGALIIAGVAGWPMAYGVMAILMSVGIGATLISREPNRPMTEENAPPRPVSVWLKDAVVAPIADFITRPGWLVVLLFIALYKYGDVLLGVMANPFYLEIGFSLTEIGAISKTYGFFMTTFGGLFAGMVVARYGVLPGLLAGGILQALSNLVFSWQAWVGYDLWALTLTISVENFTGGMATMAFVAYLGSLCNVAYTATQYALLSSLMAAGRIFLGAWGGLISEQVNWIEYFLITTVAALPGLVLLMVLIRRYAPLKQNHP